MIPEPISAVLVKSVGSLAGPLAKRALEQGGVKVLGTPEKRALNKVRSRALRATAEHVLRLRLNPSLESRDCRSLVALLKYCVDQGLFLKDSTLHQLLLIDEARRSLTKESRRLDWTTYGLDDLEVLFQLERHWRLALEDEARQKRSALHRTFIISFLQGERNASDSGGRQERRREDEESSIGLRKAFAEEVRPRVMAEQGWRMTLAALHGDYSPLSFWGSVWPVHVFPARPELWTEQPDSAERADSATGLESAKGRLVNASVPRPSDYSSDFDPGAKSVFRWHDKRRIERGHFPGVSYVLDGMGFSKDGDIVISSRVGRYFQSLATSEYLDDEMMCALAVRPDAAVTRDRLPRRSWLLQEVEDPVIDGRRRAAAVSIAAATILPDADTGGYKVLLPPRSGEVAAHRFFNHVAPSGIFQPLNDSELANKKEYSVKNVLLREFIEELHDRKEFEQSMNRVWTDVEADPEWQRMAARLKDGQVLLFYAGVSVNLLTLRPEVCSLILFKNPDTAKEWVLNWESVDRHHVRLPDGRSVHRLVRLDADFNLNDPEAERSISPANTVPNAAAALALGIRVAREISAR